MSTYTIQAGDTFSSIASEFNTTVAAIEAVNPGVNPDDLQIGQVINIPGSPTVGGTYTIQAGDTFSSIAAEIGTSVEALEAVNPGVNPDDLQVGQVINLPPGTNPPPPPPNGYVSYSGPASNFPDQSQWADLSTLWAYNSSLMSGNDD
jgi:LysM repeat protein